ncbi:type I restriction-modification system methyltransferase subunit [Halobacteroides halobius DSM 5150]|uniref:Type I restriction-modification system methyltransferase subunit n=1 Tax=Halobacteroides halobius (strain ATCC 35273 / DSM 5150 / MD-1) TaxID=748449 RepID=L0K9J8_HALHC|nr:N-6 DNA methylase [Halobacteroides halobius]AGB41039.1 type I restriction-modification system methyltransferase subunit [Halobacteroides halobius DSM 5150]
MDKIRNKLQEIGCDEIKKKTTIEVEGKEITYDLVGLINKQPVVGIDITEDNNDTKQIGILSMLSQSEQINYYGSFNTTTEEFNWYQLTEGNISQIEKVPVLQKEQELNLEEVKKWYQEIFRLFTANSSLGHDTIIEVLKVILVKVELDNGRLNALEENLTLENIKSAYQEIIATSGYNLTQEVSVTDKVLAEFATINLAKFRREDLLAVFNQVVFDALGSKQGPILTPQPLVKALGEIFSQQEGVETIFDGSAKMGQLLTACKSKQPQAKVWGMNRDLTLTEIAKLRSLILEQDNQFLEGSSLELEREKIDQLPTEFDLIVSNPEFSKPIKDKELIKEYQITDKSRAKAEELYINLYLDLLTAGGYLAIILPDGVLTNNRAQNIREFILDKSVLKAVISLPETIFRPATSVRTSLVILKKKETLAQEQPEVFMATPEDNQALEEVVADLVEWGGLF